MDRPIRIQTPISSIFTKMPFLMHNCKGNPGPENTEYFDKLYPCRYQFNAVSVEEVRSAEIRFPYRVEGQLVRVGGDGNCGARSIARAVFAPEDAAHETELQNSVRMEIMNYYRDHPDDYDAVFSQFEFSLDFPSEARHVNGYIRYMTDDQVHFSNVEFSAAAKLYGIQIVMVNMEREIHYWHGDSGPVIAVIHGHEHFNVIENPTFSRV